MVWTKVRVNEGGVSRVLSRLLLTDTKRRSMLDQLGRQAVEQTQYRFIEQKSPTGVPWKPSKRALKNPAKPTLLDSLKLLNSIEYVISGDGFEVGSNLPYAATMNFGAKKGQFGSMSNGNPIPWGDIPARPFLGVSAEHKVKMTDVINKFLRG